MNVSKEDSPVEPSYPDAKEFLKHKAAIRAAILGAGMAVGGCNTTPRLGGSIAIPPGDSKSSMIDRNRIDGVAAVEPKSDPPRLPGKAPIEPQRLPGSAPMNPNPPEY